MKHAIPQQDSIIQRYEWIEKNEVIGFVNYYVFDDVCMIMHTEVLPVLTGRGMGSLLAEKAVAHVDEIGKTIVPICGFIAHYLRKNPQHHALLRPESQRIFNIGQ